ncbi:MAG: carboxymuconolactone decarboxylase family protein [Gemmatimonadota bacterium]
MPETQIRDLLRPEIDRSLYSERELAAIDLAEWMARDPDQVPDELLDRLHRLYEDGEIVEICMVAGLFNYFNSVNNALRMPPTGPSPYLSEG